ncbi:hypothetical protein Tco_0760531, partial [Tanacetum coccineum]
MGSSHGTSSASISNEKVTRIMGADVDNLYYVVGVNRNTVTDDREYSQAFADTVNNPCTVEMCDFVKWLDSEERVPKHWKEHQQSEIIEIIEAGKYDETSS